MLGELLALALLGMALSGDGDKKKQETGSRKQVKNKKRMSDRDEYDEEYLDLFGCYPEEDDEEWW